MPEYTLYNADNAPQGSRETLGQVQKSFGFIPNVIATLAESPTALSAYTGIMEAMKRAKLSPKHQQIAILAVSATNGCTYCVAAHSVIADMTKVEPATIAALRAGEHLPDARDEALRAFASELVAERGWLPEERQQQFLDAGFSKAELLEVVTLVAQKTLSNYVNHLTHTPLDGAFAAQEWQPPARA